MGTRNLTTSRRTLYDRCIYYNRENTVKPSDIDKWIIDKLPAGEFYAKESNAKTVQANVHAGVFLIDLQNVVIETFDMIDIKRGSVVIFEDNKWLVRQIQLEEIHRKNQFRKDKIYKTYINLTKV